MYTALEAGSYRVSRTRRPHFLLHYVHRPFMHPESCVPMAYPPLLFTGKFSEQWSLPNFYSHSAWWWGFSTAADIQRFIRRSIRQGYNCTIGACRHHEHTADHTLFRQINSYQPNSCLKLLTHLLPEKLTRTTN